MNDQLIRRARTAIEAIAAEHDLTLERAIVYGSQTRDDHASDSDVDIVRTAVETGVTTLPPEA